MRHKCTGVQNRYCEVRHREGAEKESAGSAERRIPIYRLATKAPRVTRTVTKGTRAWESFQTPAHGNNKNKIRQINRRRR